MPRGNNNNFETWNFEETLTLNEASEQLSSNGFVHLLNLLLDVGATTLSIMTQSITTKGLFQMS
jgi:hypothetical protein